MSLSIKEILALASVVMDGHAGVEQLLQFARVLPDKAYPLRVRESCFKIIASVPHKGQQLPEEVFELFVGVILDAHETKELRVAAAFVLMTSLADSFKNGQLKLTRQDALYVDLCNVLDHVDGDLDRQLIATIQSYVACALAFIQPKKTVPPKFLKLYLEEALTNSLTQHTARRALEVLTARDDSAARIVPCAGAGALTDTVDAEPVKAWKSFDELMSELAAKNPASPVNASLASELATGLLARQFNAVKACFKKTSTMNPSGLIIAQWRLSDCAAWAKAVRERRADALDPGFMAELVTVLCQTRALVKYQPPRDIQILALLILLNAKEKGRIAEIATGEGKTTLVALLAAFKVLQGHTVDVISSSSVLAHRDAEEERSFFDALGITVSDTGEPETTSTATLAFKECYRADVVYGDIRFEWDALWTDYYRRGTRGARPYNLAIIDEVDSMLIDDGTKLALLGESQPGMEYLGHLFIASWAKLHYENTADHFITEGSRLFWRANKESELIEIHDRLGCLEAILEEHLKSLISAKDSPVLVPNHLKEFALSQANYWARSAIMASEQLVLDKDYVLTEDAQGRAHISPVDYTNTGVTQLLTTWTNGLHQFLQIKHGIALSAESLSTCFMSNRRYFSRYGSNLYGVTGTLGGKDSQSLLTEIYPVDLVFIPTFKNKALTIQPGILLETNETWLAAIVEQVQQERSKGHPVLVVCESNLAVDAVEKALRASGVVELRRYSRSDKDAESEAAKPLAAGEVLVATSLAGRGTDLKTKQLHVCLTYLPNQRGRDQALGRTARQGAEGSARLIVSKPNLEEQLKSSYFLLGNADSLEDAIAWRDSVEEARLTEIKEFELNKIELEELIFERFCQLLKRLKEIEDNPHRIADIEERWAFWLKKLDNHFVEKRLINKSAALTAYDEFERSAEQSYLDYHMHNPGHWISEGNRLNRLGKEEGLVAYDKASAIEPVFAFISYYNRAQLLFKTRARTCKTEALANLMQAKAQLKVIEEQVRGAQLLYGASRKEAIVHRTDLAQQFSRKFFLLRV